MKEMLKKISKKYLIILILIIAIFSLSVIQMNNNQDTITTSSNVLNNKKIGWGIKRNNNHEQPDIGKENKQILEQNKGIAMGNSQEKCIYLTFDEGYEAGYTSKILEVLKQNNVKATFFITGHYLNSASDMVKKMIDEGHIIGNHI